jgi:hypothetical protein
MPAQAGTPGGFQTLVLAGRSRALSVPLSYRGIVGLAGRIRTCGLVVPNHARWPAALQREKIMAFRHPAARHARLDSQRARRGRIATSKLSKSWYPTRDSNPEHRVSETRAYSVFRQRGTKTKKPGHLEGASRALETKKPGALARSGPEDCERYSASSPPRPNARRPRLASGDAARTCLRKSPGAKVALRSSSLVIALFPQRKRARILLIARAKVNIFFREPG